MISNINKEETVFAVLMSVLPVFLVVILSMILMLAPTGNNEAAHTAIVLISAFVIIPFLMLKRNYKPTLKELGVSATNKLMIMVEIAILILFVICVRCIADPPAFPGLVLTTLVVAVSEEFWARGCLFYIYGRLFKNKLVVLLMSTFIFVFVVHLNRGVVNNALYRLPGAMIMGLIYWKTGELQYSIGFHFIYNIIGSI